ncbi:hypothetical protein MPER_01621, partial [Moniliophthora perniciosa FA553]
MINTVPVSVTLTYVIAPIDIKPSALQVYLANDTAIHLQGAIRVKTTERATPDSVSMPYIDRNGKSCDNHTISTTPATQRGGVVSGYDDTFKFLSILMFIMTSSTSSQHSLPVETSISAFNVTFAGENHDNNGGGFPIRTQILHQPQQSCLVQKTDENGNWNLTAVAAVRDDRVDLPTYFEIAVKRKVPGVLGSRLDPQK